MSLPEITKLQIDEYVNNGTPPGSFVTAVLSNDLKESFAYADEQNQRAMVDIVRYMYNKTPINCQGSPQKVKDWIEMHKQKRSAQ